MTNEPLKAKIIARCNLALGILGITILGPLGAHGFAEEITPSNIFKKVETVYKSMDTYKAQGTITSSVDAGGMKVNTEISFRILLKKPNLYLISWTQNNMPIPGMTQSGAVWSDGTQPYVYMGPMNAYSKMTSDEIALSFTTIISGFATFTIPSMFLSVFKECPSQLFRMKDLKLETAEKLEDEDCYVISGASATSNKETFWISKSRYLILRCQRFCEIPERGLPATSKMTDEQIEAAIKAMGQKVTEDSKQKMRDMLKQSEAMESQLKGTKGFSTEFHTSISSPEMSKKEFEFTPPPGAVLKKSFGEGNEVLGDDGRPLMQAAGKGQLDIVKVLVDKGADVNARNNEYGLTPLIYAASKGHLDVVKFLVDKGADVNAREENGLTPLIMAAGLDQIDIVKILVDKGADVNAKDNKGRTPLMFAAGGQLNIVKFLVDKGADVNARSKSGRVTPLKQAVQENHLDVVEFLRQHGAKE